MRRRVAKLDGRPETTRMPSESGPKAESSVECGMGPARRSESETVVGVAVRVGMVFVWRWGGGEGAVIQVVDRGVALDGRQ